MKKTKLILAVLILFTFQSSVFSNGLSLNSIGTRSLGMGGAFVGLANDGSAIYWNPAGLIGQKSAVNIGITDIMPFATYKMDIAGIDASSKSEMYLAPNFFMNYDMGNLAFGLGVFVPAGIGVSWDPQDFGIPSSGYDFLSKIGVVDIAPSVAYKLSEKFSVGLTVNIYYAMFEMKQVVAQDVNGDAIPEVVQFEEESDGLGFGATIGLKYNASEKLSIGATVRLATKVSMDGTAKNPLFTMIPNLPQFGLMPGPGESDFSRDVTWPLWIAGGLGYKVNNKLTLAFDVQYSQWSELDKLVADYDDAYWSAAMEASGQNEFDLKWDDAIQIRLGAEYKVNPALALRCGYYYDPAPAPDKTLNVLFPSSTNHVATGGFSYSFGKISIDGALEYLFGAERDVAANGENEMPGIHQMDILSFGLAVGYAL